MRKISILLIAIMILSLPIASFAMNEDQQVTRGDFIKELLTQANLDVEEVEASSFMDVTDPEYIPYIEAAYNSGIVSGYGDVFKPEEKVTKEQAVTMIVRVFGEKTLVSKVSEEAIANTLNFSDASSISAWAKPYITYALNKGLVVEEGSAIYSQMLLTGEQANTMISHAKSVHDELFTRDGLSASDMLVLANEKNEEYTTYKQKGTMKMNIKMNVEGLPQDEVENNQDIAMLMDQGMDMDIDMDIQVETPDRVYIVETINGPQIEEAMKQEIEIFMDGSTMYTKMMGVDKWMKQDISSLLNMMNSVSSNDPYKMSQLTDDQLKFFKDYARFSEDVTTEEEDFYVVSVDIDKDTYKKYYMEIIEQTMDSVIELQTNNPQIQNDPNFNEEQYRNMMTAMISQMEIEVEYKFYINKETMSYEKMYLAQTAAMSMDNLISMFEEAVEGEEKVPDISVKMLTNMEGEFNLYDFNEEVNFPVINPEDILDNMVPQQEIQLQP